MPEPDVSLGPPPLDASELAGGPVQRVDTDLVRVCRAEHSSPWLFGATGFNRFDLVRVAGRGTCYLATDFVAATLEVVRKHYPKAVLPPSFFDERVIWTVVADPNNAPELADLLHDHWSNLSLTREVWIIVPYDLPQAWAERFFEAAYDGLWHLLRHSLSHGSFGATLFGPEGSQVADPRFPSLTSRSYSEEDLGQFTTATNIQIERSSAPKAGLNVLR